tara:strand:+ start:1095 stop:1220 length:126 start_codon:yes stop_codon:yes gene_type:complete
LRLHNIKPIGRKYKIQSQLLKKFPVGRNGHNEIKIPEKSEI